MKSAILVIISFVFVNLVGCSAGSGSGSGGNLPNLTALSVTPTTVSMAMGSTQQFTATGKYSDGSSSDVTSSVQWTSSNTSIASIAATGVATALGVGNSTIAANFGPIHATAALDVTIQGASLKAIAISPTALSVPVNTAQQFTATGSYSDGSSRDITLLVNWNSSAPAVATVNATGLVTGISAGSATLSATMGAIKQTTTVTVTAPTISFVTVSPDGLTLPIGINQQYVATANYTDGTSQDLVNGVTWSSTSTSVTTINSSGLATTVGAGSTTIQAKVGTFTDTATLTVVAAHLTGISVSPSTSSIAAGTREQFTATGTFDDGSTQLLTSVTWSSSAPSVATVNSLGLTTGVATGTANISAASGSVIGSAALTITGASLVSIVITPANSSMPVGATKQFVATGSFSDSSTQDLTASVSWSSLNPSIATINNAGLVTSIASGTTKISALAGSITGSTGLTVSAAKLVSISILPANPKIAAGTSIQLQAVAKFSDGSTATNVSGLNWKSSKPNIASVRSSGIVRGKKAGSATISVTSLGITGTTTLTVGTGTLVSLTLAPANPTVAVGKTEQFVATGLFSDGSTQDVTIMAHWSSSVASVATIANAPSIAGVATTAAPGSTVIGANSGGTTNSTTMTVQ